MATWAIGLTATVALFILVRKICLPLCGRVAISREHLYECDDVIQIGEAQGRVARIGPLNTFLVADAPSSEPLRVISNAEVFRKTIVTVPGDAEFHLWANSIEERKGGQLIRIDKPRNHK